MKAVSRIGLVFSMVVVMAVCGGGSDDHTAVAASTATGWQGKIRGAENGDVKGTGVFFCIEARSMGSGTAPATLVVADGAGLRAFGVTFSLPRGLATGKHPVSASTVWDVGNRIQTRIDVAENHKVKSFDTKSYGATVSGYVNIHSLPDGSIQSAGKEVSGEYDIQIANSKGEMVTASGAFDFFAPKDVTSGRQWFCKGP
jgi:hypothetical protein